MNTMQRPGEAVVSGRSLHGQTAPNAYQERECVMGQTVLEDRNEDHGAFVSDTSGDEGLMRDHGAHMFRSKVMPMYEGPDKVDGKGD